MVDDGTKVGLPVSVAVHPPIQDAMVTNKTHAREVMTHPVSK